MTAPHHARLTVTRAVSVYQPAVPFRIVSVWIDGDTGESRTQECPFVGVQVVRREEYFGSKCEPRRDPIPATPAPKDIVERGYGLDQLPDAILHPEHEVLFWEPSLPGIVSKRDLHLMGWDDSGLLIAPATMPSEWWEKEIADTIANLRTRKT